MTDRSPGTNDPIDLTDSTGTSHPSEVEEFDQPRSAANNLVAVFDGRPQAERALDALRAAGVTEGAIDMVVRDDSGSDTAPEAHETGADFVGQAAKGGAIGGTIGTVAGLVAGAAAFGIPGIGPAVGGGIWAAVLGAGAAGTVVGGLSSAFREVWHAAYRDAISEGKAIVSVHTDDDDEVSTAITALQALAPERLDRYDTAGERVAIQA